MVVMFHSADIPDNERDDALRSIFLDRAWPQQVAVDSSADAVLETFDFGQTNIFQAHLNGMRLARTPLQVRNRPSEMITLARQARSIGRHDQFGVQHECSPGELMLVDMNEPYQFCWDGHGSSQALALPIEKLGLPPDVIAGAASRLPASPLYGLLSSHIAELAAVGDAIRTTPSASTVSESTIDLTRALLASAYDADYAGGMMASVLMPRIRGYIRRHLCDALLSPDSVARAHDISIRKLFRLCEEADFSLEQWIITQRLEGSRAELARPETRNVAVATIARRWGFRNPSYFSRRFRDMYGVTPRAWRELAAEDPTGNQSADSGC
jgi:AraC-like DNA-binding protein